MRHIFALLSVLLLSTCAMAPAFAQPSCKPVEEVIALVRQNPMTADVHVASPAEAKLAVEIYNAMPPQSDDKFDLVVLLTATTGQGVLLLGNGAEICAHSPFQANVWSVFLRSVRGQDA